MVRTHVLVTDSDRRRLGSVLLDARTAALAGRERLHALEAELEQASPVDPEVVPHDVVTMDSTVEVRDLQSGETEVYTLVYPDRADIGRGRLSVLAPMGTALLGRRTGEEVLYPAPSGLRRVRIEDILFQPERVGERCR